MKNAAVALSSDIIDLINKYISSSGFDMAKNGDHAYILNNIMMLAVAIAASSIANNCGNASAKNAAVEQFIKNLIVFTGADPQLKGITDDMPNNVTYSGATVH